MLRTVFISYSHSYSHTDREWVQPLAAAIRADGHAVFFDEQPRADDHMPERVQYAIDHCDVGVICWSEAAAAQGWVRIEREALQRRGARLIEIARDARSDELRRRVTDEPERDPASEPLLIAAPTDRQKAAEVAAALGGAAIVTCQAPSDPKTITAAVEARRPLVFLWGAAAASNPIISGAFDQALMRDLSDGRRRVHTLWLDKPVSLHSPHNHLLAADTVEALAQRLRAEHQPSPSIISSPDDPDLEQRLSIALERERKLLLLSPRRGAAADLAERLITRGAPPEQVTRLQLPDYTNQHYFAALTKDNAVREAHDYAEWQRKKAGTRRTFGSSNV